MSSLSWKNLPVEAFFNEAEHKEHWDGLNAERGDLPFLAHYALVSALQLFGTGKERLLVASSGGKCVVMLLVAHVGKFRWQTFQPSQLPLGAWVAQAGLELAEIAGSALHGALPLALSLSVTQIDPRLAARHNDTPSNRSDDYIETAWVDIAGDFEAYWAARGKNLRQNLRKQQNKLQADSVAVQMRTLRDAADMPGAIARYGELEQSGWKAQHGTAIRPDNEQGRFYTRLFTDAAANGEAVVYEYLFNGKTVASNLCLRRNDTLVILKTTYDESIKTYSPAFLLNQDLLKSLFEEAVTTRLEYYGRLMEWHTRWTDNHRTLFHLTAFRHRWLKQLAHMRGRAQSPATEPQQAPEGTA